MFLCCTLSLPLFGQFKPKPTTDYTIKKLDNKDWFRYADTLNKKRLIGVSTGTVGAYTVLMTGVGFAWYGKEKLSGFRWFDDSKEWLQIDKTGHWFAPYFITTYSYQMLRWSGMKTHPLHSPQGYSDFLVYRPLKYRMA